MGRTRNAGGFFCAACVAAGITDVGPRRRRCAFGGPGLRFRPQNRRCATMERLRWILTNNGLPLVTVGSMCAGCISWGMGVVDDDGVYVGSLQGVWLKGSARVTLMQLIVDDRPELLDYETAMMVLGQFGMAPDGEAREVEVSS